MLLDQDLSIPPDLEFSSIRVGSLYSETYSNWINSRYHASMSYLARSERVMKSNDTSLLMQNSKSIIVFLLNYRRKNSFREGYGRIATYASFGDYHKFFPRLIDKFMTENKLFVSNFKTYVDTGPLLERGLAKNSSLGWVGKNSMLINSAMGSFTFIGAAVTDLCIDNFSPSSSDLCGKCTKCIESCPTGAINLDRTLNSNLCISYHTIENRGIIPMEVSARMDDMIFGCDICNNVCPWNAGKRDSSLVEVRQESYPPKMKLEDIAFIDKESFNEIYRGSAIKRATHEGFARNALIALYNSGQKELVREVARHFTDLRRDQALLLLDDQSR